MRSSLCVCVCVCVCVCGPLSALLIKLRDSEDKLKVTEVMGEGRYSFSIPMQLL